MQGHLEELKRGGRPMTKNEIKLNILNKVIDGTIEEIAKQVNKPVKLINWYKYPAYKRRRKETTENYNYIELVEIEDEFKYVRIVI